MTTLSTGSKKVKVKRFFFDRRGFTFIEVMVTLIILASGIVLVYCAFFISLDTINHVSYRLHGLHLLNERIAQIERDVKFNKQIPFGLKKDVDREVINGKQINFEYTMNLRNVEDLEKIFELTLTLSWREGNRSVQVSRTLYLTI